MTLTGDLLADTNRWCLDNLPARPATVRPCALCGALDHREWAH